jgi:uncharacterized protein YjiS (DUF1127 family)
MTCTTAESRTAPRRLTLIERWHRLERRRTAARRLGQLDDHLLRDIGIDRADIAGVVRHGR